MNKTIIIAEIGECFNGDMDKAGQLIKVAKNAGCDYAKFQTLDKECIRDNDPEKDWFLKIALDRDQLVMLKQWCKESSIKFLCSPENLKQAKILKDIECDEIKIASTCAWDKELVEYAGKNFSTVFLSTGMAELREIDELVKILSLVKYLYVMHCISEYPTGPLLKKRGLKALSHADVNLCMMNVLRRRYPKCKVGYSDHTAGILAPVVAVALGAKVIEKHITLDRKGPVIAYESGGEYTGTDHVLSLELDELVEMVRNIRETEIIMGDEEWRRSEGEKILSSFLQGRFSS